MQISVVLIVPLFLVFLYIIYRVYNSYSDDIQFESDGDEEYAKSVAEQIEVLKKANRWQDAFNVAKNFLAKFPKMAKARLMYAKLLFDADKAYDAIGHLNLLLKGNPDDIDALILSGDCYEKTNQFNKSASAYKLVVEKEPNNISALKKLASLYLVKREKNKAVPIYKKLISLTEDENEQKSLRMNLTNLYFELHDWNNLVLEANSIIEDYPNDKNILLYLKKAYLMSNDLSHAIEIMERLIELDPYNPKFYEEISELSFRNKKYDAVIEYGETALKIRGVNSTNIKNLTANALIKKKEYEKSLQYLSEAIAYESKDKPLKLTMAELQCLMDNYDAAIRLYDELVDAASPSEVQELLLALSDIYFRYGNYLVRISETSSAFEKYAKAIEYNSSNAEFYSVLGDLNMTIKNYTDAIKNYKSAIELEPKESSFYIKLASIYYDLENYLDAKKFYSEAVLIKPDSVVAHAALGLIAARQKDSEAAIESFTTALNIEPLNVDIRYNLALAFEISGDPKKAIEQYEKVLEIDSSHESAQNNLDLLLNIY